MYRRHALKIYSTCDYIIIISFMNAKAYEVDSLLIVFTMNLCIHHGPEESLKNVFV